MIDPEDREFMHELRDLVRSEVTKFNKDTRYSADGRRNLIAATWLAARKASEEAYEKFAADARVRHREIERKLFGPGSKDHAAIMSWRDACDRADQINGQDNCQRMFERACIAEDTMLAKAIMQRAVRHGWNDVIDSASKHMPGQADLVQDWLSTPSDEALDKLKSLVYRVPRPDELGSASDEQVKLWASQAPGELPPEQRNQTSLGLAVFNLDGPGSNGPDHAAAARDEATANAQAANDAFVRAAHAGATVA